MLLLAPSVRPCVRRRASQPRAQSARECLPLVDALRERASDGAAPFHVPGHKARPCAPPPPARLTPRLVQRGQGASEALLSVVGPVALRHDLTELDGLDYLSSPTGCIAEAQARVALGAVSGRSF